MDYTIKLKPDGIAESNAAADAVKSIREELEKAQRVAAKKVDIRPRAVREAKEDRELDRAADRAQKELIKEAREREKADARKAASAEKSAARDSALAARKQSQDAKEAQRQDASEKRKADQEAKQNARREAQQVKANQRKEEQEQKRIAKEEKDLDRAADRAQKNMIRDAKKEEAEQIKAAKKADQLEAERIDPTLKKKTQVEKAKERIEKKADEEMAARIDPSLKKLSATQKAKDKLYGRMATGAMLAGAAAGAAFTGVAAKLAPLAIGYMGMARLSMISAQASFNMRRLFMGTNAKPLLDAVQRTSQLLDPRTFTGDVLGKMLRRGADGVFAALAKAEPYVRLFFKGMLYGALSVESAWLDLQIAIAPVLKMIPDGMGLMTAFETGSLAVGSAVALMGVGIAVGTAKAAASLVSFGASVATATLPLLPYAAAIGAIVLALTQAIELKKQWDENSATQIKDKLKADLGITSQAERDDAFDKRNKIGKYYVEKPDAAPPPKGALAPKGAGKAAAAAGPPIGKNLGLGMLAGMKDVEAKVAAGGRDLVLAAEGGAKAAGEIKSPARKWRREIGRNLGEGAALGLEDSAGRIESAAASIVPSAPGIGGGILGRAGVVIQQIGPFFGMPVGGEEQVRRWVFDALDDAAERAGALA